MYCGWCGACQVSLSQLEGFKLPVRKWLGLEGLDLNISIRDGSHKTAADILSQPDLTLEDMEELMAREGMPGKDPRLVLGVCCCPRGKTRWC